MLRRSAALIVGALLACGAEAVGKPSPAGPRQPGNAAPTRSAPADDPAVALAAALPAGADRCVVARPARLPADQRPLLARISQAESVAWLADLTVDGFASAQRERRDGPTAQVLLLVLRDSPERVRAVLDARLALRWDDGEQRGCVAGDCPGRARFVQPQTLRIERGDFGAGAPPGVEPHCLRIAQHAGDALELSVARTRGLDAFGLGGLPLRSNTTLRADARAVYLRRFDLMRSAAEAQRVEEDGYGRDPLAALGGELRRSRADVGLTTELDLTWQDLELALADDARVAAASREAEALARAELPAGGLPSRREDVLAELGFRLESIERATGDARSDQVRAARELLEAALAREPEDEGLGRLLAELILNEQRDPAAARALVRRFGPGSEAHGAWAALGRHAAALLGAEALADALVEDGMAPRRQARTVAREIVDLMQGGMRYSQAERAALDRAQ